MTVRAVGLLVLARERSVHQWHLAVDTLEARLMPMLLLVRQILQQQQADITLSEWLCAHHHGVVDLKSWAGGGTEKVTLFQQTVAIFGQKRLWMVKFLISPLLLPLQDTVPQSGPDHLTLNCLMSSWMNPCALSLELCDQHLFRGCQSSATSPPLTSAEWQQQVNFSVRSAPQPSLSPDIRHRVPSWSPPDIKTSSMARGTATGRSVTTTEMDWRVGCFKCRKPLTHRGPFHYTSWIRPTSSLVVNVEPLSHWPGSICSQTRPLESGFKSCGAHSQTVFKKNGHPFYFFHNSLKWLSIYTKFLPDVAEEMLIQNIWTKYGC